MFEPFVIFLTTFLLGYLLGRYQDRDRWLDNLPESTLQRLKNNLISKVVDKNIDDVPIGSLKRPTAHDLYIKNQDPKVREGKDAIKETLDANPELAEGKKIAAELKRKGIKV